MKELKQLLSFVGRFPNEEQLENIIDVADVDENGRIDFGEFKNMMERFTADEAADEELREAFKIFDKAFRVHCQPTAVIRSMHVESFSLATLVTNLLCGRMVTVL